MPGKRRCVNVAWFERDPQAVDYLDPVVDIRRTSRLSRSEALARRGREPVRLESGRILQRHVRPDHNGKRRGA